MTGREANKLALEISYLIDGMVYGLYAEGFSMARIVCNMCDISPKILEYLEFHVSDEGMNVCYNLGIYPAPNKANQGDGSQPGSPSQD